MAGINFEEAAAALIETTIRAALAQVPAGTENAAVDAVLDKLESLVDGTPTPIDDAILEPIIARLRSAFNVPDGAN